MSRKVDMSFIKLAETDEESGRANTCERQVPMAEVPTCELTCERLARRTEEPTCEPMCERLVLLTEVPTCERLVTTEVPTCE